MTLLVVGLGFVAGLSATRDINSTEQFREPILSAATEAQADLLRMRVAWRGYLISGDERDKIQYDQFRILFEEHLKILESLHENSNIDRNVQNIAEVKSIYRTLSRLLPRMFSLHDHPLENRLALQLARVEVRPLRTQILDQIDELLTIGVSNDKQRLPRHRAFLANLHEYRTSFDKMTTDLVTYAASGEQNFKLAYDTHLAAENMKWAAMFSQRRSLSATELEKLNAISQWRTQIADLASRIFMIMESDQGYQDVYLFRTQVGPRANRMMALLLTFRKVKPLSQA
jgi:hypothetical protein